MLILDRLAQGVKYIIPKDLLWAAARVLTDWPRNFQVLLRDICPAAAEFKTADSDDPDLFRTVREAIHGAYVKSRVLSSASFSTLPKVASSRPHPSLENLFKQICNRNCSTNSFVNKLPFKSGIIS